VVRTIGACYTYKGDELPLPVGLNERILEATLGTAITKEVKAPLAARLAARLRFLLDPIVSPQLATVATMLLVAVFVLTNTVSADGSISGMYNNGLSLAGQGFVDNKDVNGPGIRKRVKEFFVGDDDQKPVVPARDEATGSEKPAKPKEEGAEQRQQPAPANSKSDKR
jgi:hypothetical protein